MYYGLKLIIRWNLMSAALRFISDGILEVGLHLPTTWSPIETEFFHCFVAESSTKTVIFKRTDTPFRKRYSGSFVGGYFK